ncbi:MAG: mechanosensitive ion channel, partial [Gammaproteobacteria bacterium]|nr:mechanosensitive ion channel [Gammaproteobacteria bacterium]
MIENKKLFLKLILHAFSIFFAFLFLGLLLANLSWIKPKNSQWNAVFFILTELGTGFIFLSFLLLAYMLAISICKTYKIYFEKQSRIIAEKIISLIHNSLTIIFILIAINMIISILKLNQTYSDLANDIIYVIIICTIAWTLLQILAIIESIIYTKYKSLSVGSKETKIISSYTKIHILRNIASLFIIIVAIASALMVFDKVRNIGVSLLASVGFLTAIAALAAQKTLSSLFIGLQLVLSEPIKIGDLVVIENESGIIEEISLTYVVIKIWDGRRLILPISYFVDKSFQNWSRETDGLCGVIKLEMGYTVPIDDTRKALNTIL